MQLVPFHEQWSGSETKLDLKAIYRRPSVHGGFTLTGPLPLRRSSDWKRKGYEYVTLASLEDVAQVATFLGQTGVDLVALRKSYLNNGPFDVPTYLKTERQREDTFLVDLQAKVDKFGVDAVVEMMKLQDPGFVMPQSIATRPKSKKAEAVPA